MFTSNKMTLKLILFLLLVGRNFSGNKFWQNWQEFSSNVHSNLFHIFRLTTKYEKNLIFVVRLKTVARLPNKFWQNWQEFSSNVHSNLFHIFRLTTKYEKNLIFVVRLKTVARLLIVVT